MARHHSGPVDEGRLLVQGPDRPGIVAAVSTILSDLGANIIDLDQHSTGPLHGQFFQRTVFYLPNLTTRLPELHERVDAQLGQAFGMDWRIVESKQPKRVALLASKSDHCLLDLLWRQRRGELAMEVPMVISNHTDLTTDVRQFGIPYFHVPVTPDTKSEAEAQQLGLLKGNVDLVVLARYMQILSPDFLDQLGVPVINIHHSFLPAFIGAAPYERAKERGVKLVGATAHYVTQDLDQGPIIEQDVVRVSHEDTTADLRRLGADVERQVLARAVQWHCEDRLMTFQNTTVVL